MDEAKLLSQNGNDLSRKNVILSAFVLSQSVALICSIVILAVATNTAIPADSAWLYGRINKLVILIFMVKTLIFHTGNEINWFACSTVLPASVCNNGYIIDHCQDNDAAY